MAEMAEHLIPRLVQNNINLLCMGESGEMGSLQLEGEQINF